jgi:hypothetical protein
MPVTVTLPDALVDAVLERRGSEPIFDKLADLLDYGFHYSAITYPNATCTCGDPDIIGIHNYNGDPCIPDNGNSATRTSEHRRGI